VIGAVIAPQHEVQALCIGHAVIGTEDGERAQVIRDLVQTEDGESNPIRRIISSLQPVEARR